MKQRIHNVWFMPVSLGNRKSCPTCHAKHDPVTAKLWAWGEYSAARWYTIKYFCEQCYSTEVLPRLTQHASGCGCTFELCARLGRGPLPAWLTLDTPACAVEEA